MSPYEFLVAPDDSNLHMLLRATNPTHETGCPQLLDSLSEATRGCSTWEDACSGCLVSLP